MKQQPLGKLKGVLLLPVHQGDDLTFRVYDENDKEKYTDYYILHSDLRITIEDPDAYVYKRVGFFGSEGLYIDHSPTTLGKEHE